MQLNSKRRWDVWNVANQAASASLLVSIKQIIKQRRAVTKTAAVHLQSPSSNVCRWTCVFKAYRLQSGKDFSTQRYGSYSGTKRQNSKKLCLHCAGPESVSSLVHGCVSVCAPVIMSFQTRAWHSWGFAVETGVALLNQCRYEHAHSHSNPVKAGSVWQTGMLNQGC